MLMKLTAGRFKIFWSISGHISEKAWIKNYILHETPVD